MDTTNARITFRNILANAGHRVDSVHDRGYGQIEAACLDARCEGVYAYVLHLDGRWTTETIRPSSDPAHCKYMSGRASA